MKNSSEYRKITIHQCYHCGDDCKTQTLSFDDKYFCCEGCKLVYDLLKENNLCTYYNIESPGISPNKSTYTGKYDYLNIEEISKKLIRFKDEHQTHITFYIPGMHCSSCIWLLENLHRLNANVISSTVNFPKKEVSIVFNHAQLKLSEVAELLVHIGYEPLIHLNDLESKPKSNNRKEIIKIGIAGFCFGNIMMLSFPEYFSLGNFYELQNLNYLFGYLNLFLSLPVFFYCASGFFSSAYKSIRHGYLNIDTPIALAIAVTFTRSIFEILSHNGIGYMDSMTGIVFFMLIGRYFQNKTYETLSFERDYKSYFPVAVIVKDKNGIEKSVPVSNLKKADRIIIRNNELVPADAILLSKQTHVDHSFITGESAPVKKLKGEFIYAGAKQLDGAIELEIVHPTSQSYLTQLWNKDVKSTHVENQNNYIHSINKYFTIAVLLIAAVCSIYWAFKDPNKALNAFSAVLIVACPCGLLLTSTFAHGAILRIFGKNKLYLKNSNTIEKLASIDTIVFDKTGTITQGSEVHFVGPKLNETELNSIVSLASQSSHPLSRKIASQFTATKKYSVSEFNEITGKGIKGYVNGSYIILGSEYFVTGSTSNKINTSAVFLMMDGEVIGYFSFNNAYREGLHDLTDRLSKKYVLTILSGDNDSEKENLKKLVGEKTPIYFNQKPEEKKRYIKLLQDQGKKVAMIGDGLNDAGALLQSNVGIAVSDDTNTFSPASDAILDGSTFTKLPSFIYLAKAGKKIIVATFILSLTYNIIGLSFAVQGKLSPVIAAILMPASSISIVLLTTLSAGIIAKLKKL